MMDEKKAWFEFLLTPSLLEGHLKEPNTDPDAVNLIIQFIFSGIKNNEISTTEADSSDIRTQDIYKKKNRCLNVIPLQIAAFLKWNLDIFQEKLPLQILDVLLSNFLFESLDDLCTPNSHSELDTINLLPHQIFSVSLYHRFVIRAVTFNKLPDKPLKVSNVPIPGQQDPTFETQEVKEGILSILESYTENSVRILNQILGSGDVKMPTMDTFSLSLPLLGKKPSSVHFWIKCILVCDEQFKCQIHYDLGEYHFLKEEYNDAYHHFSEALLFLETEESPEFCSISKKKLKGYYSACANICGRKTPVCERSPYDQFQYAINNKYENIADILLEDTFSKQIPLHVRNTCFLDLMAYPETVPEGTAFQVETMNVIQSVFSSDIWNPLYINDLIQSGKPGANFLMQSLASKMGQSSGSYKDNVRNFILTLNAVKGMSDILVPALISCATLASLFTHEEIVSMWKSSDEKLSEKKLAFDVSFGADYNDFGDLTWDLIHSYDPKLLKEAVSRYINITVVNSDIPKTDIMEINYKWDLPKPVYTSLMKLPATPQRYLIYLFVVKAQELCMAKSYISSLELLKEACDVTSSFPGKDSSKLFKFLSWLILRTKIQWKIEEMPSIDEESLKELSINARQCLSSVHSRGGIAPWTNVIYWCLLLLINSRDWELLCDGNITINHHILMSLIRPLATVARSIQEKSINKKPWSDLWEAVTGILSQIIQIKRNFGNSTSASDKGIINQGQLLEFINCLKDSTCLSVLISLHGRIFNLLVNDSSSEVHIEHAAMWPSSLPFKVGKDVVRNILCHILEHATNVYAPSPYSNPSLSSSWHLTLADMAFSSEENQKAMQNYLTSIFMATDYLRNDVEEDTVMTDIVIRRMIRCCMNLNCYTQAAILCQFLENIDYNTALMCLQERNSVDGMDAFYNCLWDTTLMEFIINLHHKRGEVLRRDKVINLIGLLELNSHNNEEIQHEAAKVRKHRFLRAISKLYL